MKRLPFALLCVAARASAGGFEIYDQSPSGTAMAGAVSAKADNPSALFYNPAGIAARDGDGAQLGATVAFTQFSSRTFDAQPTTTSTTGGVTLLPQLYVATHLGERVAIGLALFPQFGAGVNWSGSASFPGRFIAENTQIQTLTLNPTFAVRANERLAFAVGLDVVLASVELDRAIQFGDVEGTAQLGGAARGVGVNAGVLFDVVPQRLSAALAYRSAVNLPFDDLRAHFIAPPELKDQVYDQSARTALTLPHNITFGLAFFPTNTLSITTDLHYTLWSDFKSIDITFPDGKTPGFSAPQNWRDSWSGRSGAEYLVSLGPGRLAIRIGFGYDLTPVPASTLNPTAPLSDRLLLSGGLGYTLRRFTVAVAYIAGLGTRRSSTDPEFPTEYRATLSALSFAISYQWGKAR